MNKPREVTDAIWALEPGIMLSLRRNLDNGDLVVEIGKMGETFKPIATATITGWRTQRILELVKDVSNEN